MAPCTLQCLVAATLLCVTSSKGTQDVSQEPVASHSLHLRAGQAGLRRLGRRGQRLIRRGSTALAALHPGAKACGALGTGAVLLPGLLDRALGIARSMRFWRSSLPIWLEYRLTQRALKIAQASQEERDRRWDSVHQKHADNILNMVLSLRGFYVKLGQVCSTRRDMFPQPWIDSLSRLQGEHPELLARPVESIKRIVWRDLGRRSRSLVYVEPQPLGAAATGQVHRARLEDGREVVLKVQYPEASRLFRVDFSNTKTFCRLLQPEHLAYIEELERQFATEFDYRREATDLAEVAANAKDGRNPYAGKIWIPKPVMELSSRNIVVMEYLPGETLLSYAKRRKRELERSSFLWALWQGWRLRRELQAWLALLVDVQGFHIFVDGVFNGDPHPGNILVTSDGRMGLIDYGNTMRLSPPQRALLGHLIIALATGERRAVVEAARRLGFKTEHGNEDALFRYARVWFDRDDAESMAMHGAEPAPNVQVYVERLNKLDPLTGTPEGYLMAARNSFLMRGLATHIGTPISVAAHWQPFAEAAVQAVARDSPEHSSAFVRGFQPWRRRASTGRQAPFWG